MCACKQKKASFLIDDILSDKKFDKPNGISERESHREHENITSSKPEQLKHKFEVVSELDKELELAKINGSLDRRNTYPLYPMAIKANFPFPHRVKGFPIETRHLSFYSDPLLKSDHILRNQLAVSKFVPTPYSLRQPYGFDRGKNIVQINNYKNGNYFVEKYYFKQNLLLFVYICQIE